MTDATTGQTAPAAPAAESASTLTLSREDLRAELSRMVDNGPERISPHRTEYGEGVTRNELPYRFGRQGVGEFSLATDLGAALKGDYAASERTSAFVRSVFATATTDVNELNPTGNRPDLYVDQKEYGTPMWSAIDKGSITNATPFTVPAFNSAASLVAAHVEGTEPSVGSFTTTALTVTPAPLSGKVEINREVLDQGGNPQVDTLIWRQMTRAWFEALEAKAVAVLAAISSPTQINLTAGVGDDVLAGEIDAAFVALQYVRGGFRFNDLFLQVDLFKKLAAAVDSAGRKLYPMIGATNANGTASPRYGSIDVAGVRGYPGWALAATGSVEAASWLFDREYVAGWASAPQRIDLETQVKSVFMGLWGYAATAVLDESAVRRVDYDPVA